MLIIVCNICIIKSEFRSKTAIFLENFPWVLITQEFYPFIDVYVINLTKSGAFDYVVSKLYEVMYIKGKIIYLGDSENDNPVFRKADISVGVKSDNGLNPPLDCTCTIKFENLPIF